MKRKLFTFLMAFLATLSGAVWGQDRGTADNPLDIGNRNSVLEIDDSEEWFITTSSLNTKGIVIKSGGVIDDNHNKPTIHLINVNLQAGGSAIIAEQYTDPIFILEGVNTIQSNGTDAAIRVPTDPAPGATLTIDARSTGILNIIMEDNENTFSDKIAIGNTIAGPSENIYDCGSITVNGGTIKTNGRIGRVNQHGFRFSGNAIVIANEITGFTYNDESLRNGGLLFLNDDTPYVGQFHTPEEDPEFTLSSPLPEPYKIELRVDGVKLEIGEDQILNEDQLIDLGGQIKGYKVTYSSPDDVPMTTNVALPVAKFVNTKYTVEKWEDNAQTQDENTVYKHIDTHWLKNGTEWVNVNTEVTETEPTYTTLSNIEKKEYQAVWYLQNKTISYNLVDGFVGAFNLWYPDADTDFLFTATEQSGDNLKTLAQVGLQLSSGDNGNGNTIIPGSPITDEGTFTTKLNLASSTTNAPTGLETTLTVETSSTELNISDDTEVSITFKGGSFTYNGNKQENISNLVSVVNASTQTPFTYGTHYFLKFTQEGNDVTFQDAGDYTVTVIAVDNNGLLTGEKELSETVTITPATLTIKEVSDIKWTISETNQPNYEETEFTLETVYSVGGTKDDVSINKDASGFTPSVDVATWETTPGTYTVNYSGLELTGTRASNYTLSEESGTATGKLIVNKDLGEEGEEQGGPNDDDTDVKIDDTEEGGWKWSADDNAYVRKYDGTTHSLDVDNLIKVRQENGDDDWVAVPADKMEISYDYTAPEGSSMTNTDTPKNVGSYVATITISEDAEGIYVKGNAKINLKITEADLTVDLKLESITWAQMGNPKDLLVVDNFGLTYNPESLSSTEGDAVKSSLSSALENVTATATADENKETATITINGLKLVDTESFYADNYNVAWKNGETPITPGEDGSLEIDGIDITPETPEDEDLTPAVDDDEDDWKWNAENGAFERTYDGEPHNLTSLKIKNLNDSEYSIISAEDGDYAVTYTYSATGFDAATETVQEVKKAGYYKASITLLLDGYTEENIEMLLYIAKADLSVDLNLPNTITVEEAENPSTWWSADDAEVNAVNEAESNAASVTGNAATSETELTPGETVSITISDLKVNDQDPFFSSNYNDPTWGDGITVANGSATVEVTVVDDDPDYPGGEVTPGDEEGDDDTWTWNVDKKAFTHVYDGHVHSIETIIVTKEGEEPATLHAGTDFTVSGADNMKNVGKYTAVITFNNPATYGFATIQMPLEITKRPMKVDFNLPSSVSSLAPQKVEEADVDYELESETIKDRGLLNVNPNETYPVISDNAQFVFTKTANDKCKVTLKGFLLQENPLSGFDPDNYQLQIWDATKGDYVDYNNDGSDITIVDPDGPNEDQNPNLPEDGDGNIDYNPGGSGDDDDNDHGHGGSDINRPAKYYNMYVDSAATCDGVELWFNKNVVREGNQASVYVKIEEGYDAEHMKLWFKRSLYGYWEELEEGVQPGEYIIYNVYTDIYVKATDVEKDPTGIEEIEGVKVYAQNGSIYVYTPNRLPVWIVSMTGAVVRNEEQVGLQQYDRLNQGIYIVRVGEQVFKIRL